MEGSGGLLEVELFVGIVAIATAVALITRRSGVPYSVALVLVGLGIAFVVPEQRDLSVTPELILAVLLPGLVFEAAYQTDIRQLRATLGPVLVLAAPGVVITAGIVAVVVSATTGLDLGLAFVLGAIISATDPAAVIAIFKQLGTPRRLSTMVEAESLLNDGTGIVLFAIALRAISGPVGIADGVVSFVLTVAVSVGIGVVAGFVATRLIARVDDHLIEAAISLVAAYGTYLVADRLHESGIIATVVVGLFLGTEGKRYGMSERTREALDVVWEFIAFLLTAVTFLLVGLVISPDLLVRAAPLIAAGFVAITAARALVVYGLLGGTERLLPGPPRLPVGYLHVMFWSGLRGAVAIALALSLPVGLEDRDLVTGAAYGIVLITLVVQGTTAALVVRRAGVLEPPRTGPGPGA